MVFDHVIIAKVEGMTSQDLISFALLIATSLYTVVTIMM